MYQINPNISISPVNFSEKIFNIIIQLIALITSVLIAISVFLFNLRENRIRLDEEWKNKARACCTMLYGDFYINEMSLKEIEKFQNPINFKNEEWINLKKLGLICDIGNSYYISLFIELYLIIEKFNEAISLEDRKIIYENSNFKKRSMNYINI